MDKPIPAFYACYLLRSTVRHQSLYVGSTPNPQRRLRQHNGDASGGAARTSRDSLRPWEMACLVTGFPSKIAALQFEWAWQNTHLTHHVSSDSRLTQTRTIVRTSYTTGRTHKRKARPTYSLTDRLANLHLLLRAKSFESWPLKVTFYVEDVFRAWQKWSSQTLEKLRPGIDVTLDAPTGCGNAYAMSLEEPPSKSGIPAIDVGYSAMKPHLRKGEEVLVNEGIKPCALCQERLPENGVLSLVCPHDGCSTVGHLDCFASYFLDSRDEGVMPTTGNCPGCATRLEWIDLVKELSLRMRGEKEIEKVFKVKKARGAKVQDAAVAGASEANILDAEDDAMDDAAPLADDWNYLSSSGDDELFEPVAKKTRLPEFVSTAPRGPEPVVEDSEWDDAEIVT